VPNDPAPRHGERHAKPVRDGLKGHAFRAQSIGKLVEIGAALAAHGRA
jgi:hypothetical protein